jgi:hypothetical protein
VGQRWRVDTRHSRPADARPVPPCLMNDITEPLPLDDE